MQALPFRGKTIPGLHPCWGRSLAVAVPAVRIGTSAFHRKCGIDRAVPTQPRRRLEWNPTLNQPSRDLERRKLPLAGGGSGARGISSWQIREPASGRSGSGSLNDRTRRIGRHSSGSDLPPLRLWVPDSPGGRVGRARVFGRIPGGRTGPGLCELRRCITGSRIAACGESRNPGRSEESRGWPRDSRLRPRRRRLPRS